MIEHNKTSDCVETAYISCNESEEVQSWLDRAFISSYPMDLGISYFERDEVSGFGHEEIVLDLCSDNFIKEMNEAFR